uniref:RRM domain-containing protein n=1 Tax=Leucosporidium scottii TaxID=5278 RepID=A0A0H5FSR5_9BASI|nr:hypothetical protein ls5930a1_00059 [Leucosporidium scottii]
MSDPVKTKKSKRSREDPTAAVQDAVVTPPTTSDTSPAKKSKRSSKALDAPPPPPPAAADSPAVASSAETTDDTPALSHKEKRLAKRRKLAGLPERPPAPPPDSVAAIQSTSSVPTIGSQRAPGNHEGGIAVGATPAKGAQGIWVGNMNFATTSKDLLAWFEERGLKEVTRINMPKGKRSHENNRGFAYLDFPTETDVTIAVGLSEHHLDGRKLLIKSSSDYSGRPAPSTILLPIDLPPSALIDPTSSSTPTTDSPNAPVSGRPKLLEGPQGQTLNRTARKILDRQRNPAGPTLFLGNLGFETRVEDIRMMFDAHQRAAAAWAPRGKGEKKGKDGEEGEKMEVDEKAPLDLSKAKDAGIRKIRLGTFEDTGKCKGWAFVDFHLPEQCTRALLNIRNHSLDGRSLNVEYASSEAVRRGGLGTRAGAAGPGAGAGRGGRGGGRGGGGGDAG